MEADEERMARLRRMPLELVLLYARVSRSFVDVVIERWATGRDVPAHCAPSWVADLAQEADLAAQVATRRGATGLTLNRHPVPPGSPFGATSGLAGGVVTGPGAGRGGRPGDLWPAGPAP